MANSRDVVVRLERHGDHYTMIADGVYIGVCGPEQVDDLLGGELRVASTAEAPAAAIVGGRLRVSMPGEDHYRWFDLDDPADEKSPPEPGSLTIDAPETGSITITAEDLAERLNALAQLAEVCQPIALGTALTMPLQDRLNWANARLERARNIAIEGEPDEDWPGHHSRPGDWLGR